MPGLLDKRLIFVAGKGGVGKSTVAAALGLAAAARGMRTILVEVARQERLARAFAGGGEETFVERELAAGLFTISIDPAAALEEYLLIQLKLRPLADVLASSRMFQYFAAATPGMPELVTMGKVWELAQLERRTRGGARYDLVIVDSPATGHGVGLLRTPRAYADIARVGPIARQARAIHEFVVDPTLTGVIAVAQGAEMPVNETLALREQLREQLGLELDRVVVNALYPVRFDTEDADAVRRALNGAGNAVRRAALRAALSEHTRALGQRAQTARLREQTGMDPVELPYLFEAELGLPALETLSHVLEAAL